MCPGCLSVARINLKTIVYLHDHLMTEAVEGRALRSASGALPGGDALVLLSPGADRDGYHRQLDSRRARGLPVDHVLEERKDDPRPPAAVLAGYCPATVPPDLSEVARYLGEHLHDLARGSGFLALARDLTRLVRSLEVVLHEGDQPEVTRVPCWDCGQRLVKLYGATSPEDHWMCPRCHQRYDAGRFARTKADHLASDGADRYVAVTLAAAVVGRSVRTLRQWIKDGRAASDRDATSGRVVVWWPHVRAMHVMAQQRKARRSA